MIKGRREWAGGTQGEGRTHVLISSLYDTAASCDVVAVTHWATSILTLHTHLMTSSQSAQYLLKRHVALKFERSNVQKSMKFQKL